MSRVLFVNQPSVGHLTTLLNVAVRMRADGHDVSFLTPGFGFPRLGIPVLDTARAVPDMIGKHGIRVGLLRPTADVLWHGLTLPWKTGFREVLTAVGFITKGLASYARQVGDVLARERPDVVVADFGFPAAGLAAERAGIPFAPIYHSGLPFRGDLVPPFGSGLPIGSPAAVTAPFAREEKRVLDRLDYQMNVARRRLGLPPTARDVLRTPLSPWLNLIASVEAAEVPRANLTATTWFVGPCFGARQLAGQPEFPFNALRPDKFKVYVSLGTVFNDRPWFFRKIFRALAGPEFQVVVSAGAAHDRLRREAVPENVLLFRSVPQAALLPKVDLFISHGGNNSVNESLSAGTPLVVAPVGGEQADNAARVVHLGFGRRIDIEASDEADIRAAVNAVRADPGFARRLAEIRAVIATTDGPGTASRLVAKLAETRAPVRRD